ERAAHRAVGGVRGPVRNRGLERRLRARGRPRRLVAPLGRGPRARRVALRARDGRLAPSRVRQRLRVDDGACRREDAGRRARRAAHRPLLRLGGPGDPPCGTGRQLRRRALQPCAKRDALRQSLPRRARERGPARLPERVADPRARRGRPDHRLPAREACARALRPPGGRRPGRPPSLDESAVDRIAALERLGSRQFDLLVVGGGIVGAGIAEAASAHGLEVALLDKGDFAGATSSASSKLIHGGLRYLRLGDIGLVREAHYERRVLMNVVAPHLVRRLPFLFPLYEDGPYRPWFVQTGIVVYSTLARAKLNGLVCAERAEKLVPQLHDTNLRACAQVRVME